MPLQGSVQSTTNNVPRAVHGPNDFLRQRQNERTIQEPISRASTPSRPPNESRLRRDSNIDEQIEVTTDESVGVLSGELKQKVLSLKFGETILHDTAFSTKTVQPDKPGMNQHHAQKESAEARTVATKLSFRSAPQKISTFDDTEDLSTFDDNTSNMEDEQTTVFRGPVPQLPRQPYWQSKDSGHDISQHINPPNPISENTRVPVGSQEQPIVVDRRKQQQLQSHQSSADPLDTIPKSTQQEIFKPQHRVYTTEKDLVAAAPDTPSRTKPVPSRVSKSKFGHKEVAFAPHSPMLDSRQLAQEDGADREDSPELIAPSGLYKLSGRSNGTTAIRRQTEAMPPPLSTRSAEQPKVQQLNSRSERSSRHTYDGSVPSHAGVKLSHEVDFPNSSEDEQAIPRSGSSSPPPPPPPKSPAVRTSQGNRKRSHEDSLDYTPDVLKSMSFDQLAGQTFTEDPRDPVDEAGIDPHGQPMTLSHRLANLGKMRSEDQKIMLRSQTDNDWEQTGLWFIEKFTEDLKKLMDARLERRKLSMRYEHEVRKRHKDVEWCTARVDDELKDMKNSGGKLIEGRHPGSRGGTPRG